MVQFQLLDLNDLIPSGYRLATKQDVANNELDLVRAMPGYDVANLADGSVEMSEGEYEDVPLPSHPEGMFIDANPVGAHIRDDIRNDATCQLAVYDPNCVAFESFTFQLFNRDDCLPPEYRLATVQDVQDNPQALRAAMPGREMANLENGAVYGAAYECFISRDTSDDAAHQLAVQCM